jgi:hypothetical protein
VLARWRVTDSVQRGGLNVRAAPSKTAAVLLRLPKLAVLEACGREHHTSHLPCQDTFHRLTGPSSTCWQRPRATSPAAGCQSGTPRRRIRALTPCWRTTRSRSFALSRSTTSPGGGAYRPRPSLETQAYGPGHNERCCCCCCRNRVTERCAPGGLNLRLLPDKSAETVGRAAVTPYPSTRYHRAATQPRPTVSNPEPRLRRVGARSGTRCCVVSPRRSYQRRLGRSTATRCNCGA